MLTRRTSTRHQDRSEPQGPDSVGPSGDGVLAVLTRLRNATPDEIEGLTRIHPATQTDEWSRARRAAWDATWTSGRVSAGDLAVEEIRLVSVIVGMDGVSAAAEGAAEAAVVHDLVGRYGYTKEHQRILTGPWRSVMGIWNGSAWLHRVA